MDVASTLVSNVVPSSYPVGAEEARKTAQHRAENPQIQSAQQSANSGGAAGGQNALGNSLLYAQSEAIISASAEQIKKSDKKTVENKKDNKAKGDNLKTSGRNSSAGNVGQSSAAAQTSSATASSAAFSGSGLKSAQGILYTSEHTGSPQHAKYSESAAARFGKGNAVRTSVIADRYNSSSNSYQMGGNINFQA